MRWVRGVSLALMVAQAGCGRGGAPAAVSQEGTMGEGGLTLTVEAPARVAPGDSIGATLALANRGAGAVTLNFMSAQQFDLILTTSDGTERARWSADRGFAQMLTQITLGPGEDRRFEGAVRAPEEPGSYRLVGLITAREEQPADTVTVEVGGS